MGLFDFLDRMAKGEPVFQDASEKQEVKKPDPPAAEVAGATIQKFVDSSFPVVFIKAFKLHESSGHLQVYCEIANEWPNEVELDKIRIFNTKRELDTVLRGHEERDFLVYDGPALTKEYHEIQLDYKTQKEGDYFQAVHDATFLYRPDTKTFVPGSIRLRNPVRDIYG